MQRCFGGTDLTIVLERPDNPSDQRIISQALKLLEPYIIGLSTENAIKILDQIEAHPLFNGEIGRHARGADAKKAAS